MKHVNNSISTVFLALCLFAGVSAGWKSPTPLASPLSEGTSPEVSQAKVKQQLVTHLSKKYKRPASEVHTVVSTVFHEAAKHNLPPLLVLGLIEQESSLVPEAASGYGALGLMQVVPRFHRDKLANPAAPSSLLHPKENVRVGTAILAEYLGRARGDMRLALKRYSGDARDYAKKVLRNQERLADVVTDAPA